MERQLLRVDLRSGRISREPAPPAWRYLGGRGLTAAILHDEVPAGTHPLGEHNKLVIAPGLIGGTSAPCSGRISAGAKSPLTLGIKESNGGGTTAQRLARLGIHALIIEGRCARNAPHLLRITRDACELVECGELKEMGTYRSVELLRERFGPQGFMLIGPAGERLLSAAGIANTDMEGRPSRYCARGGLGAVMGSKGLKAIVIDDSGAGMQAPANPPLFRQAVRELSRAIQESPHLDRYARYSTNAGLDHVNGFDGLPTRNFSRGRFDKARCINGEALRATILERKGNPTHRCMPGCSIQCSNVFPGTDGREIVSPLEYETIGLIGSNCEIASLDTIAQINMMCNDYGLDTIEIGGALGIAMEVGHISFGDDSRAIELVREIGRDSILGRVIGHGAAYTAKLFGLVDIPVVKGQMMAAYEPRALKGLGVTYATSPMGADHTAGHTLAFAVNPLEAKGQKEVSREAQIIAAVYDTLGLCMFVNSVIRTRFDLLARLVNGACGCSWTEEDLSALGRWVLRTEKAFNSREGIGALQDRLPDHFTKVENPDSKTLFDVTPAELDEVLKDI
jgi:aldehyde:ferredoxin oxidoreductase